MSSILNNLNVSANNGDRWIMGRENGLTKKSEDPGDSGGT